MKHIAITLMGLIISALFAGASAALLTAGLGLLLQCPLWLVSVASTLSGLAWGLSGAMFYAIEMGKKTR